MKSSIVHLYLYGMIKREANGATIHISKLRPIVKWTIRLPQKYQAEIIKELVSCGFLKKIGRDNYEVLICHKNPLYDSLGDALW